MGLTFEPSLAELASGLPRSSTSSVVVLDEEDEEQEEEGEAEEQGRAEEPSAKKRKKVHAHAVLKDWFLDFSAEMAKTKSWSLVRCLEEATKLAPDIFGAVDPNTPRRWKYSAERTY
eukprot:6459324-Amphidinium_carterae.1